MLKANLGCGNKLYPCTKHEKWFNVDIVAPENLEDIPALFIESDLKQLIFADNLLDEVHSYHVIEHFHPNDLLDILKEWKRVLKPDGKIILEAPDIVKCCASIILGIATNNSTLFNRMGLIGIYGDAPVDKPYMRHLWGYTGITLKRVLEQAGFVDVTQETPQTHMKEHRDFRLVARKPVE